MSWCEGRCSGKCEQLYEKVQRWQETCLAQLRVKVYGWKEVKWLQKYRTCWATEKQFFLKRQKQFSGESKKLWDLLFMDASTLTSEHQPKLKLVLCVWIQDCAQGLGWAPSLGGGREAELSQPFNVTPMVLYPAWHVTLCLLLNPPLPISKLRVTIGPSQKGLMLHPTKPCRHCHHGGFG